MEDVRRRPSFLDRMGDPAAPSRYGRRRRDREQAGPPKPPPPEPFGPEPEDELVCVRCCTTPVQVAWSQAENRLIHTNVIGAAAQGGPRICGGLVMRKGEEWRQAFTPGIVVPCLHTGAGLKAHLVRLGRPAENGGPSWTGTSLCGVTNPGRHRNWRPLYPAAAAQAETCQSCKEAYLAEMPSTPAQASAD